MEDKLIYKKMAAIMQDVKAVTKSRTNQSQGFKFRGIDEVMNELHEVFANHEVFIIPQVQDYTTELRSVKKFDKQGHEINSTQTHIHARIKFSYVTTDGSSVSVVTVGEAMDVGDKAMNKAMSIALKYALLQTLLIPTDEKKDPDEFTPADTDFYQIIERELTACLTKSDLMGVWERFPAMQADAKFKQMFSRRKEELK